MDLKENKLYIYETFSRLCSPNHGNFSLKALSRPELEQSLVKGIDEDFIKSTVQTK